MDAALRKLAGEPGMQSAALFAGGDGRLRLFFRQPVNKNWLKVGLTIWDGSRWSSLGRGLDGHVVIDNGAYVSWGSTSRFSFT